MLGSLGVFAIALQLLFSSFNAHALTCTKLFDFRPNQIANGLIQPLTFLNSRVETIPEPIVISSYGQITGQKIFFNTLGQEIGKAFLIEPIISNVREFPNHRGDLQLYKTEINDTNRNLFTMLGFIESFEPGYGHYMSQVPDAKLFTYLKNIYNKQVPDDMQIHVGVYESSVISAHQSEMVANWLSDTNVTLGNPRFGSVLGAGAKDLVKPVINGREKLSTFRHDLEHFGSIVLIPKKVVEVNQQVGQFWMKILTRIKELDAQKKLPKEYRKSAEYRAILDAVYLYNRRFHSLTHVLGMLVRAGGAIDINQQRILDFGQSADTETPTVHWPGLGFKPDFVNHDNLPFPNRLFDVSLENARADQAVVSIADAYGMITNDAVHRARQFTKDFVRKFPASPISGLLTWLHDFGINDLAKLSDTELEDLQSLTLIRHQEMGNSRVVK